MESILNIEMAFVSAPVQVYIQRPNVSLRGTTFQTRIHTTQCGSCDFVGNVKYDVFLHNIRIHRKCIICAEECFTKKGIMDHLATVHDEKVNCDMCDFQVSFPVSLSISLLEKMRVFKNMKLQVILRRTQKFDITK